MIYYKLHVIDVYSTVFPNCTALYAAARGSKGHPDEQVGSIDLSRV